MTQKVLHAILIFMSSSPQQCLRLAFPTGRDSETFRDNGTEVPSLSRDKGTTGQAKNLAKGRDGPGQPKTGTGHGTKRDRAEKDVLKQKKDALKQKRTF